jgi:hypothetical protein
MPIKKKIKKCPKSKLIKLKGKKCKKCEFYSPKKWYVKGEEIDVFCTYHMTPVERKFIK